LPSIYIRFIICSKSFFITSQAVLKHSRHIPSSPGDLWGFPWFIARCSSSKDMGSSSIAHFSDETHLTPQVASCLMLTSSTCLVWNLARKNDTDFSWSTLMLSVGCRFYQVHVLSFDCLSLPGFN
jgi:hypothetical protein